MATAKDTKARQEFAERAIAKVKEKLAMDKLPCQLCGIYDWQLEKTPAFVVLWDVDSGEIPIFSSDSKMNGLPLVALTCKNCGNTLFVNAMVLGLGESIEGNQQRHG